MANHLTGIGRVSKIAGVQSGKLLDRRNSFSSVRFYQSSGDFRSAIAEKCEATENNVVSNYGYTNPEVCKSLELEALQKRSNYEREAAEKRIKR